MSISLGSGGIFLKRTEWKFSSKGRSNMAITLFWPLSVFFVELGSLDRSVSRRRGWRATRVRTQEWSPVDHFRSLERWSNGFLNAFMKEIPSSRTFLTSRSIPPEFTYTEHFIYRVSTIAIASTRVIRWAICKERSNQQFHDALHVILLISGFASTTFTWNRILTGLSLYWHGINTLPAGHDQPLTCLRFHSLSLFQLDPKKWLDVSFFFRSVSYFLRTKK